VISSDGSLDGIILDDGSNTDFVGWAPDGSSLLFFSERATSLGLWSVPVVNGKRAGEPRLVKGDLGVTDATYAGVTRAGSVYYRVRGSTSDVYLATLDATGDALVAPPSNAGFAGIGANAAPAWSADGKTLAFLSVAGTNFTQAGILNTINIETGARRRVTLAEPMSVYGSAYGVTGEGSNLAFLGQLAAGGHTAIDVRSGEVIRRAPKIHPRGLSRDGTLGYTVTADRTTKSTVVTVTDLVSLTSKESCRSAEPFSAGTRFSVSPDGLSAAFESPTGPKRQGSIIRILRLATCESVEVHRTEEPIQVYAVTWTPDGKRLLFSTQDWSDAHKHQLWSIAAAGGKPTLYDVNIGLINHIAVHPDGRRLALDARRNEPRQQWVLERFLPPAKPGAMKK
jgi:Tol biopolymer transport system component